jgi:hypothetical protein
MTRRDDQRIADILDACGELADLAAMRDQGDVPQWVLDRAAERLLELVGGVIVTGIVDGEIPRLATALRA